MLLNDFHNGFACVRVRVRMCILVPKYITIDSLTRPWPWFFGFENISHVDLILAQNCEFTTLDFIIWAKKRQRKRNFIASFSSRKYIIVVQFLNVSAPVVSIRPRRFFRILRCNKSKHFFRNSHSSAILENCFFSGIFGHSGMFGMTRMPKSA